MKQKIFFIAAASAMAVTYIHLKNQWTFRSPSSLPSAQHLQPTPTQNPLQIYSYQDVMNIYSTAIDNETRMREETHTLQGMLTQAQHNLNQSSIQNPRRNPYRNSPYSEAQRNIRELRSLILRARTERQNNLSTALHSLRLTYGSIQLPPTDGSVGLSRNQHANAIARMHHLNAISQHINSENRGHYIYPEQMAPYLTAALSSLPQPVVTAVVPTPAPEPVMATQPAPVAAPIAVAQPVLETTPVHPELEAMVEPVFEETSVAL